MTLDDLFKVTTLTESINKLPLVPGQVGAMGLFAEKGIRTTSLLVEQRQGRLFLVPNTSRNDDGHKVASGKRNGITFEICHLPLADQLLPGDLQDIRAFGQEGVDTGLASQAQVINDKLQVLKNSIEATREWHRVGAIRGQILDANGEVIHDLYDKFGVTKKSTTVALGTATTDVRKACLDAKRYAEKKLGGVVVTGYRALCGSDWFDKMTSHPKVEAAFANWQAAQDRLAGDMRSGFTFGGIEFVEYNAEVSGQAYIPANVAQVFPVAQGVFVMNNAPANYNEAVNTIGLPYYAKSEPRKMGKGWEIEAQSNPLALCLYPEALVELKF